jgi:hypothetical protein
MTLVLNGGGSFKFNIVRVTPVIIGELLIARPAVPIRQEFRLMPHTVWSLARHLCTCELQVASERT